MSQDRLKGIQPKKSNLNLAGTLSIVFSLRGRNDCPCSGIEGLLPSRAANSIIDSDELSGISMTRNCLVQTDRANPGLDETHLVAPDGSETRGEPTGFRGEALAKSRFVQTHYLPHFGHFHRQLGKIHRGYKLVLS